jgi:hypothetical protein
MADRLTSTPTIEELTGLYYCPDPYGVRRDIPMNPPTTEE